MKFALLILSILGFYIVWTFEPGWWNLLGLVVLWAVTIYSFVYDKRKYDARAVEGDSIV